MSYLETLAAVRASYTPEKRASEARTDLPSYALYRPLSFFVTPLFMTLGFSANAVTTLGIVVSLGFPLAAWLLPPMAAAVAIAAAGLLIQVLDSVDGNIARTTGKTSAVGQMLDHVGSLLFWVLYFIAVGVLAERTSESLVGVLGVELGLSLAVMMLTQRELEDTFDAYFGERVRWEPPLPASAPAFELSSLGRTVEHLYAFVLLVVAALLHSLDLFLASIAAYQTLLFVLWLPRFVRAAYARS